ncbi:OmpA family protein [Flagellimonas aequoris]|uniref:OmpA family protein n=1 Tax=Flagellimonas aequoris TaxID=2306997 RepID=A0A418NCT5_9FLAO|nr:OmpA family protein [Allomuricauda aequoris]TXK08597.1 OmpA family protein [Allomuricauda aequoris]
MFAFLSTLALSSYGQNLDLTKKDSIVESYWLVSLGTNIVDDSGDEFRELFDIKEAWNIAKYPSRLSFGRYFKNGMGIEMIGTFNKYREGKIVDDVVNPTDINFFSIDLRTSYDLNMIIGDTGFFDPYVGIGVGYTNANNQGRGTYNGVLGFRTWLSDHWGLDFNTTGKWTMNTDNATNLIQHAFGVAYRFQVEKGLSRKGLEKLALLEEIQEKQQKVKDSIAKLEEDERLLAERMQKEREAVELAAAEQSKQKAEEARREALQDEVNSLGNILFEFNSSYLTDKDKELLDKLTNVMRNEPDLVIKVMAHTDSRGTQKYNQWLSERRAQRTVEYMVLKGVSEARISHEAYGETKLVNECKDGVYCTEEEHAKNRRSEFVIQEY